jgi:D-serine deaminase-like pyridoxal phosphate-dependent protein
MGLPMSDVLESTETPVGVLDLERVRRNAARVASYCAAHGLAWRPHIKTHKSTRVAAIQLAAGATGLTVATPREAEVMSQLCDDILLAYPPLGRSKLDRLIALSERVRLSVALDSDAALRGLAHAATEAGRTVDVLVEIDVGLRRVGVETPAEAVALARVASDLRGVRYRGVMFYPGHIRVRRDQQDDALGELDRRVTGVLGALEGVGLPAAVASGGSTPTLWNSHRVRGLTEIRAGSCIFNDLESAAHASAAWGDLAYTVLATVVSTAVRGQAVVDAGSKALAKEIPAREGSYGALLDRPEVKVTALSEEHGVLDLSATDWRPRVGDRVRIVPNHVCVSVNLQDHVLAVDGGEAQAWELEARGRGPYSRVEQATIV